MWELIRKNRRRSLLLFLLMGLCLLLLGFLVGSAFFPPEGGFIGLAIAFAVWVIWSLVAYFAGDSITLAVSGARKVTPDVHPQLFNIVEEMKIAAGLPAMPEVYIIDEAAPNAFATGRKPEKAAIAVTAGLLNRLNRDELQGVVAHETAHIMNRDILLMTFSGIFLGSIVMISEVFLRGMWYSGGTSRRYRSGDSSKGGGQAQIVIMIAALVFAVLAPLLARLLYLAISRKREYLADASGVRLTRYPEGLASALESLTAAPETLPKVSKAMAPMYIVNPLKKAGEKLSALSSTHPPIAERVAILRALTHGVEYAQYQKAFNRISRDKGNLIPSSGLKEEEARPIRKPTETRERSGSDRKQKRDLGDLMRAVNRYAFLTCAGCGLKVKTPPDFTKNSFPCPRCKNELHVPVAAMAGAAAVPDQAASPAQKSGS
ncbi:MAG: M48 family metallopeptidase, partial [Planctomycetes bacterium]|nr:M48 family metallopeptidase [Planctomycetota bacterium]